MKYHRIGNPGAEQTGAEQATKSGSLHQIPNNLQRGTQPTFNYYNIYIPPGKLSREHSSYTMYSHYIDSILTVAYLFHQLNFNPHGFEKKFSEKD